MKSLIIFSVTIIFYLQFGESAVSIKPHAVDPDHPGKCVDKDNNIIMNPGETQTIPSTCTRVTCGTNFDMDFATCGTIIYPSNCRLGKIDKTKNYPKCCPKPLCDDEFELEDK